MELESREFGYVQENEILRRNIAELQLQLQNAYIKIDQLLQKKENNIIDPMVSPPVRSRHPAALPSPFYSNNEQERLKIITK